MGDVLTDILSIAMGNKSLLRISSGNVDFELDFQTEENCKIIGVGRVDFIYLTVKMNHADSCCYVDVFLRKKF